MLLIVLFIVGSGDKTVKASFAITATKLKINIRGNRLIWEIFLTLPLEDS